MALLIAGDGTIAEASGGWGGYLKEKMPRAAVYVYALPGGSSKSFLAEAGMQPAEEKMKEGDVLLIQFGWNDAKKSVWKHTDPFTSYMNCLSICADTARTWGTVPVLLTQIPRPDFENGKLRNSGGDYPQAVRMLGRRAGIAVIDLYQLGSEAMEKLGAAGAGSLFEDGCGEPRLTEKGGRFFADLVYEGLNELGLLPAEEATETADTAGRPAALAWKTEEGGN